MYHIQTLKPLVDRTSKSNPPKCLTESPCLSGSPSEAEGLTTQSLESTNASSLVIKHTNTTRYRGIFGHVTTRQNARHVRASSTSVVDKAPIVRETIWKARPSFMSYVLEIRFMQSFDQISRSLNVYPVVTFTSTIKDSLKTGDLRSIQVALSNARISPLAIDEDGWSLLDVGVLTPSHHSDV
jgi:hypothetical protein